MSGSGIERYYRVESHERCSTQSTLAAAALRCCDISPRVRVRISETPSVVLVHGMEGSSYRGERQGTLISTQVATSRAPYLSSMSTYLQGIASERRTWGGGAARSALGSGRVGGISTYLLEPGDGTCPFSVPRVRSQRLDLRYGE